MRSDERDSARRAVSDLRAIIGGGNLMEELKKNFGVRAFNELPDSKMQEVEDWAKARVAANRNSGSGGKPDLNPTRIYEKWNARKAGVRIREVKDGVD